MAIKNFSQYLIEAEREVYQGRKRIIRIIE